MPSSAEINMGAAFVLGRLGRWDAAVRQAQRALTLDPLSPGLRHSAIILALGARQYDLALEEVRRAQALAADDPVPAVLQAYALLLRGQPARCVALKLSPLTAIKAMCLQALGRTAEAKEAIDSISGELLQGRYLITNQYAEVAAYYARLGDVDRSLEWLGRGIRQTPVMNDWELSSGLFDRVGKDPRFQAGLARLMTYVRERVAAERRKLGERLE
jgi:tetratricopeptide (TPR) repeat protein